MRKYKGLIVDLDGVVWRGGKPIPENVEALRILHNAGIKIVFLTNNSTRSRRLYSQLLTHILGFNVRPEDVVTSAYAATKWLRENMGPSKVYVVGEEGLVEELVHEGHTVVTLTEAKSCKADVVVVGLDRNLTYKKLLTAHILIKWCGKPYIVTNIDATVPVEDADMPGAGTILAALERSTGKKPAYVTGKPNPWIVKIALSQLELDKKEVLLVGDRLDTDIEAAVKLGIDSLLVYTGVTRPEDVMKSTIKPTYQAKNLLEGVKLLELA